MMDPVLELPRPPSTMPCRPSRPSPAIGASDAYRLAVTTSIASCIVSAPSSAGTPSPSCSCSDRSRFPSFGQAPSAPASGVRMDMRLAARSRTSTLNRTHRQVLANREALVDRSSTLYPAGGGSPPRGRRNVTCKLRLRLSRCWPPSSLPALPSVPSTH